MNDKAMHEQSNRNLALCLLLIAFGAFFRVFRLDFMADLPNFAPLMAIAFCGALFLPGWLALIAPLGALIVSDVLLDLHYGASLFEPQVLIRYACFGIAVFTGFAARRFKNAPLPILGVAAGNSLLFYVITNTVSWLTEPAYAASHASWLQALTVGVPGYPPTWTFLRNSLVSDLLFTSVFLAALHFASRRSHPATALA